MKIEFTYNSHFVIKLQPETEFECRFLAEVNERVEKGSTIVFKRNLHDAPDNDDYSLQVEK